MRSLIGELAGATLLDVGCNVGFFCHFFSSLGMQVVGIDNSQHNRYQRFSLSNSVKTARRMNHRYDLSCEFVEGDARKWVKSQAKSFDVTLLLSVLHHFFLGYPMGEYEHDPMEEAKRFIEDVARVTRRVLYIEYEDGESSVSVDELIHLLRSQNLFRDVSIIGHSDDFNRPMIRCSKR
jgi:SAM-dependent methyltransferase